MTVQPHSKQASTAAIWAAMISVYIVWGSTYLAIRYAVATMPPFLMAGVRFLVAGLFLYGFRRLRGDSASTRFEWRSAAIVGLFLLMGGNGGVVWAEQRVVSGVAALLVGSSPLWMVLIDALRPGGKRPGWQTVAGVLVGFAGIALLIGPAQFGGGGQAFDPWGIAALLVGGFLWAVGSLAGRDLKLPASPLQWTVRKRFTEGVSFDLNYTWSKSIDLGSTVETDTDFNAGQIQNAWAPGQMRGVSDYDVTHLVSASWVAELPFGRNKRYLGQASGLVDAILGGWQVSGIWRQSSGLPVSVGNGFNWPTNWQVTPNATQVGVVPAPHTTKNAPASGAGGAPGPNIWPDPAAALAAYGVTLPGESGQRNGVRGDGYFSIDLGLGKRLTLFRIKDQPHTLQFRAEAFNITNSVRFNAATANLTLGDPNNFGKYTDLLTRPRVMQFSARYEF
ncbi:MAG TPA: EamA family transporter [Anaerolineales bacterium]